MVQNIAIVDHAIVNINPATGKLINHVPCTKLEAISQTILPAAQQAQIKWAQVASETRMQYLKDGLAELHAQHSQALVEMIVQEMGKPLKEAQEEVEAACNKHDFFQLLQTCLQPKQHGSCTIVRQPLGVVALLSPWNFPADEILLLLLPALASGNTVVVKPSEVTPNTGAMVVDTMSKALPPNVLQLVQGDGSVGAHLVESPLVNMIAMTGSYETGKKILKASHAPKETDTNSTGSIKRIVLELGGKDPMVVFESADLQQAAKAAVKYSLSNTGQVCCSIERIFVAKVIYDQFVQLVVEDARENYTVGDGMDPTVNVGPMVSDRQREIVREQVDDAIQHGATLLYQSEVPSSTQGFFYPVTVLANVTESMRMYREETFGPVVCLIPFDGSEEEGIRLANDTEYGLAASVYTQDLEQAERVATAIQAGQVGINCYSLENLNVACPWAGHKNSGHGFHSGEEGFHQFSLPKSLVFAPSNNK
jgi:acyl-CoA reductase-like NAD-dependent aldehyde dehydrogenase